MGTRYILEVECPECGFLDGDVYFAPTCGFTEWKCPKCDSVVNLVERTGVTPADASSADEMRALIASMRRQFLDG